MPLSLVSRCRAMMFSAVRFFSFHQDVARVLSVFETHFYFSKQASKTPKNQVMQHEMQHEKGEAEASPFTCSPHWLLAYIVVLWYNLIKAQPCPRLAVIPTEPIEGRWCYGYILGAFSASHVACGICWSDCSDMQKKMTALTSK